MVAAFRGEQRELCDKTQNTNNITHLLCFVVCVLCYLATFHTEPYLSQKYILFQINLANKKQKDVVQ